MRVTIIGTGYVGLVTGTCLSASGHHVTCVDLLPERVACINQGQAPFHEPGLPELLRECVANGRLRATVDLAAAMEHSDLSFIAVGTPAREEGIDLHYVENAATQIGAQLHRAAPYHVVVVKSTVVPGTSETLVLPCLEAASGRKLGDFGLCMNPEFLREGSAVEDFMNPDRLIIGQSDARAGQVLIDLYAAFSCPVVRTTPRTAELIKYASNTLLATLVSFSNELAALCEQLPECDIDQVMDGLHLDRRLSPEVDGMRVRPGILAYLRAGSGYGGSCLPKDVYALRQFAHAQGVATPLLDAVSDVNTERPTKVVARLAQLAGSLRGKTVAVLGLTFKPGTDDLRNSPALSIITALGAAGAQVRAYDPIALPLAQHLANDQVTLCATAEAVVDGVDAAVIATAWPEFATWEWVALSTRMCVPLLLDARNAFRNVCWPAPIQYYPIGIALKEMVKK